MRNFSLRSFTANCLWCSPHRYWCLLQIVKINAAVASIPLYMPFVTLLSRGGIYFSLLRLCKPCGLLWPTEYCGSNALCLLNKASGGLIYSILRHLCLFLLQEEAWACNLDDEMVCGEKDPANRQPQTPNTCIRLYWPSSQSHVNSWLQPHEWSQVKPASRTTSWSQLRILRELGAIQMLMVLCC